VVIAEKAEQLDLVIAAAEQLLKDYPGAPESLQKPAVLSLANAYERSARFPSGAVVRAVRVALARGPESARPAVQRGALARGARRRRGSAGRLAALRRAVPLPAGRRSHRLQRRAAARAAEGLAQAAEHWREFQRGYARTAAPGQLLLARYNEGLARREVNRRTKARPRRSPR